MRHSLPAPRRRSRARNMKTINTVSKIALTVLIVVAPLALSSCRSGEIDSQCLFGPIPDEAKMKRLKAQGVKTIVNCRLNRLPEKERTARALGLRYEHIPTGLFGPPKAEQINAFLAILRDKDSCPIYVCDQVARDRVQFYSAVYGMRKLKWSADKASNNMYRNGLRHWWPWFYSYKPTVQQHESAIQNDEKIVDQ